MGQENQKQQQQQTQYQQSGEIQSQQQVETQSQQLKEDQYDIQLEFENFIDFIDGFKISGNKENQENAQLNSVLIGVLGNFNSGKTYVLSKLSQKNLPQGNLQKTKGFNVIIHKKSDDEVYNFIDTAGCGEPIRKKGLKTVQLNNIDTEDLLVEQIQFECFLHEYTIKKCHVIILTLDRMNQQDQKFINRVQNKFKKKIEDGQTKLIIIHNFKNIKVIEELKKCEQNDIEQFFSVEKKGNVFYDYSFSNTNGIIHLCLGFDGCDDTKNHNEEMFSFITKEIESVYKQKLDGISIYSSMVNYVKDEIKNYFEIDNNLQISIEHNTQTDKHYLPKLKEIFDDTGLKLKNIFFDYCGRPIFDQDDNFPYDKQELDEGIVLTVDIPGIVDKREDESDEKLKQSINIIFDPVNKDSKAQLMLKIERKQTDDGKSTNSKRGPTKLNICLTEDYTLYDSTTIKESKRGQLVIRLNKKKLVETFK